MPLTIIAVATSRNASTPLLADLIKNLGKMRLRIRLYRTTKRGRLPMIVETRDTGPLSIAQNDRVIPIGANVSLKTSKAIAEFFCFISFSCLRIWGRNETSKKMPDMQNAVR